LATSSRYRGDTVSPSLDESIPVRAWWCLAACTLSSIVLQLDGTLVNVALPELGDSFDADTGATTWALTAYFVAYALVLIPGGRLVDRLGPARIAVTGLGLFALASLAGALAPTLDALLASRLAQGAAAGLVSPAALAGAIRGFPPHRRGAALGIWGAASGAASLIGPLTGGALTVGLGWRACWWALLAFALTALVAMARLAPGRAEAVAHSGTTVSGGRSVVASCTALTALAYLLMIAVPLLGQQYLQEALALSALSAAAWLLVITLTSTLVSPFAGRFTDRHGEARPIALALTISALALATLGSGAVPIDTPAAVLLLIPFGVALGLLFSPISRAALNSVPRSRHGRVSATLSAGGLTGAALGSALVGAALHGGVTTDSAAAVLLAVAALTIATLPLVTRLGARDTPSAAVA
jgi:MFS family permease